MTDETESGGPPDDEEEVVIDFNTAKQKRARGRPRKTPEQEADDKEDLMAAANQFLDENPMWYVLSKGVYYKRRMDGQPIFFKPSNLNNAHVEWGAKFAKAIAHVMRERGWQYNDVTYAFSEQQPDMLNLMDKSMWIQPEAGECHPVFDWITHSIGGGKAEAVDHIRHCICHKYLHPEDYTLPALALYGEGGIGKNVMVQHTLKLVFAGQTLSTDSEHIIGKFNSLIAGMALVMFDESMADKGQAEKARQTIGNSEITANPKGIQPFKTENTAWYWIGSNEKENGGIWLDRSKADRRYSVIHIEDGLTLEYWIAVRHGWLTPHDFTDEQYDAATKRADKWLRSEGIKHLRDPKQIAAWLFKLIEKYGERDAPRALHGEDYEALLGVQERMYDRIIHAVFSDPDFTHICKTALYRGYEICSKQVGEKGKVLDRVLYAKAKAYIKKHRLTHIDEQRFRQDTGRNTLFFDTRVQDWKLKIDNTCKYLEYDKWIGPEV